MKFNENKNTYHKACTLTGLKIWHRSHEVNLKPLNAWYENLLNDNKSTYPSPSSDISKSAHIGNVIPIVISFVSTSKPRTADLLILIILFINQSYKNLPLLFCFLPSYTCNNDQVTKTIRKTTFQLNHLYKQIWRKTYSKNPKQTRVRRSSGRSSLYIESRCARKFSKQKKLFYLLIPNKTIPRTCIARNDPCQVMVNCIRSCGGDLWQT